MRFALVAAAVAAAFVSVAQASPVVITETLEPWGRCFQEETTYTRTITAPGATATYHDPRTTTAQYTTNVYPRAMAARTLAEEAFPEETTIVEVQPCAETVYTTPTSTFVNPQYTTTVTEWAATTTIWSTYTLCVGDHICG